ncbi:hypothetical protein CPB84DRAFT_1844033 [Gymnopilus junonius]|uniref:dolichol kinase n=1 Tax=Gymnopilus junonius TaxID=109634 RepID=A0A9P5NUS9_GYMJU|nr:hypothetical protein CPB84DRAFT_1844033 [Gymnopilus junonius]
MPVYGVNLWTYLNLFEATIASLFFQFTLYVALRLAHRGFTLGELGLTCFGEFGLLILAQDLANYDALYSNVSSTDTSSHFSSSSHCGLVSHRFLLSPFLVLSRNIAQRPVHRLRFPQEKERNRKYYALGFYVGSILIVGLLIGLWTRWCLGNRDPWLWVIFRVLEGKKKWTRPALLAYWALLGIISVAGWNRQLARSRRFRLRNPVPTAEAITASNSTDTSVSVGENVNLNSSSIVTSSMVPLDMFSFPNIPNLPSGANMTNVATDLLDAADKHVPTLGLNARRKFFHGLAVVMFVPGIAFDPAFTHLSFSAAFAMFTFAEYVRYFAIYPFGASLHLFMNEFLDHRDSGTAILSHFYLLTGCAGSLWLEGPSHLLQFTGVLTLGLGDAAASIVGRRIGSNRWSPTTSKTLEGSLAFVVVVYAAALMLRLAGHVEPFSVELTIFGSGNDIGSTRGAFGPERQPYATSVHVGDAGDSRSSLESNNDIMVLTGSGSCRLTFLMLQPDGSFSYSRLDNERHPGPSFKPSIERSHISGYMVQQRSSTKRLSRPSTAPSISGDGSALLPSISPSRSYSFGQASSTGTNSFGNSPTLHGSDVVRPMQTLLEDDADVPPSSSFESYPTDSSIEPMVSPSNSGTGENATISNSSDYDWATFISAYSAGRWDPHRTPNPPRSYQQVLSDSHRLSNYELPTEPSVAEVSAEVAADHVELQKQAQGNDSTRIDNRPPSMPLSPLPPSLSGQSITSPGSISSLPSMPLRLPTHRFRNSFSDSFPNTSPNQSSTAVSDIHTSVATMRWAAARVDISPLALPSPERELADPMHGITATIPGSHPPDTAIVDYAITPGGTRKPRLNGFWEGTIDIDDSGSPMQLYAAVNSPSEPPMTSDTSSGSDPIVSSLSHSPITPQEKPNNVDVTSVHSDPIAPNPLFQLAPLPATVPVISSHQDDALSNTDYFGYQDRPLSESEPTSLEPSSTVSPSLLPPPVIIRDVESMPEDGPLSVPALPRRVCLTRQTSSPLPDSSPADVRYLGGRVPSESLASVKLSKAAKEERMFAELEYLAPPYPPDELERRRALYKFNIWNTGPDLNFDRIAHLAKLVFNTKGVIISLIDTHEQWFKSEWGLKTLSCSRTHTFCGHAILQRGDEPMVVLDTSKDWRFEKNPQVIGPPHIRFYAGAPLRTHDGYNIGTLAVIDDQSRGDFSPRQRHTLKEFAAIAMREMELWKDKIQLRIRDRIQNSMEQFSRECLEIDTDVHDSAEHPDLLGASAMDKVYDRAAKLVKRTLDVEGVIVMDVSHCEVLESMSAEGSVSINMHHGDPSMEMTTRQLTAEEYSKLNSFFEKYPDGRISEGIIPPSFKPFLPTHVQYALTVPIFNIDKRPFALLCAYNTHEHAKQFLEGHELSYLRAIGVIILSAVLKRRMILADKAKGLFISNISHELRTPLHGILAAAELLSDSSLNHAQQSFLQTVQACGTSLVETVNHVLDFTKLSGNSKAGGVENVIVPSTVDLMQLVEEAVDGCWIGHRARTAIMEDSGIGSVYSPPNKDNGSPVASRRKHVETVVDIGYRSGGWTVKCEKGGIRRVLMNLFGNSLKFTSDGYVHVILRELPPSEDDPPDKIKVELAVFDTGKGISQNFLKNQLFHPFSQENPLQTGTGLGLAIVSSIVTSEHVAGKVDVWSEEGVGTEIKVTFPAEVLDAGSKSTSQHLEPFKLDETHSLPTVSLIGFSSSHKGVQLLRNTLNMYLTSWWGFEIADGDGDIVIVNEDLAPIIAATEGRDTSRAYIILSGARGNPTIMSIASEHERIGGFCRIIYKPGGPSRLRAVLKLCLHALKIGKSRTPSPGPMKTANEDSMERSVSGGSIFRRNSEEASTRTRLGGPPRRPHMTPRSSTANPLPTRWGLLPRSDESIETPDPDTAAPAISLGSGGSLLKSSLGSLAPGRRFRVLVVEDNSILRNLLIKWLSNKGYEYFSAVDGRDGVSVFEKEGPFDVVLLDLSMPVLDGIGATTEIRRVETKKAKDCVDMRPSRILALTGMSSLEDKRRAFEAGVDGYLVKPVAFKVLDDMFHKLGVS